MKRIFFTILISLTTVVALTQVKSTQPNEQAKPEASLGNARSDYVLRGRITDLITLSGIASATIEAVDSHMNHYKTLSDKEGNYRLEHLPREKSFSVRCSQLEYSPNPKGDTVKFLDGVGTWNPRLVQPNGDAAYLQTTVEYLAGLPFRDREVSARYISANLLPATRLVVAEELTRLTPSSQIAGSMRMVDFFTPGPLLDNEIRLALEEELRQTIQESKYPMIKIRVANGHAILDGIVTSQADKELVGARALAVPSPLDITNNVTVSASSGLIF